MLNFIIASVNNLNIEEINICDPENTTLKAFQVIGYILFILKILIPILIIVLGMIDFGKSAISSDEKAMQKSAMSLVKRIIIGIAIFFVPLLVKIIFNMIGQFSSEMKKDYINCVNCLTSPYKNCDTSYKGEIFNK